MPQSEQLEVVVLGSGTGGKLIACHMAQSGRRTAVVETHWVGGSCPNIACMPSKNEISSAKVAQLARDGRHYGTVTDSVTVDMATVRQRKREMVERQIAKHLQIYKASGAELIMGSGRFVAPKTLEVKLTDGGHSMLAAELLQVGGRSGDKVTLSVRAPSGEQHIDGSDILVAAGRIPNTAGIGLMEAGVELDKRGYIRVNGRLETSAPDVWAVGECAGSPQFTHISEDDFRIIRDNLAGGNRSTRDRLIPYCTFTDPPLARVGLSEGEAERQGFLARVARLPMDSVLGAQATDQD